MTPSISYSSRVKYPQEHTASAIRWPCLCTALTETLQLWPCCCDLPKSLPQIDLPCTTKSMRVVHWSGQYCCYFSLMKPKLVISRVKQCLCSDLRACYCQSCQRDKRITGEILSMRVNEGRVKTHFLDRLSLAIQLNKDDGLSLWYSVGMRAVRACVIVWVVCLESYSHHLFEQQFPFIDPCKVPGSVNI